LYPKHQNIPKEKKKLPVNRSRPTLLKQFRQLHLYLGAFFAPSIIFFALSGSLQLFGLHEGRPGETYQPPALIAKLASIHKNQTLSQRQGPPPGLGGAQKRPPEFGEEARSARPEDRDQKKEPGESQATFALKLFFLATATGLVLTTCLGVYMGFKFGRSRILIWSLLLIGTAIPAALIAMTA
jgi:hypothetical protein